MSHFVSRDYWEERYVKGGTSGAGSYKHLAQFKADVINLIVPELRVHSIIDFGVGDGNQLRLINLGNETTGTRVDYTGVDVSPRAIAMCRAVYPDLRFMLDTEAVSMCISADMVMSCDVIYLLVEDSAYEKYMDDMFRMASRYVLIYARDSEKNHATHVKFRKFTTRIATSHPEWNLCAHIPQMYAQNILGANNESTSPSDFYIYKKGPTPPSASLPVRRGRVVITGSFGSRGAQNVVYRFMEVYARRVGADFYVLNDHSMHYIRHARHEYSVFLEQVRVGRGNNIAYAFKILSIHYMLQQYESVLWLDDSCIVDVERCEDVFTKYNSSLCMVAAYNEGERRELSSVRFDVEFVKQCKNGFMLDPSRYVNTGVLLCHTSFLECLNVASLMDHTDLLASKYPTQAFFNYIIQSSCGDHRLSCIDPLFNTMFFDCEYNETGRKKIAEDIADTYLEHSQVGIFHVTGFYKNRGSIIRRIAKFVTHKLITISLTTWSERLGVVHLALQSILNQDPAPRSIVLWLASDEIPEDQTLPESLQRTITASNHVIKVRYVPKNIMSYKKLVPALLDTELHDHCIVTADDDIIYQPGWFSALLDTHIDHPKSIVAHRVRKIKFPEPYVSWPLVQKHTNGNAAELLPTGCGGILYPPRSLHKNVLGMDLAMHIAPTADDLFFWIHALMNRTPVVLTKHPMYREREIPNTSKHGLAKINVEGGQNDLIFRKLLDHYNLSIRV
jgi:hypothetical protein